jgi:hypothetical protein
LRERCAIAVFHHRGGEGRRGRGACPAPTQDIADRWRRAVVSPGDARQGFAILVPGYDRRPILLRDFPPFAGSFHGLGPSGSELYSAFCVPNPRTRCLLSSQRRETRSKDHGESDGRAAPCVAPTGRPRSAPLFLTPYSKGITVNSEVVYLFPDRIRRIRDIGRPQGQTATIFPGLKILAGSRASLIARMTPTASPCSAGRNAILP